MRTNMLINQKVKRHFALQDTCASQDGAPFATTNVRNGNATLQHPATANVHSGPSALLALSDSVSGLMLRCGVT
jgi:hypothetical protein